MMSCEYGRQSHEPDASAPLDAWSFAQRLLGKPFPGLVNRSNTGRPSDELLAWLATVSPQHANQVRAESAEQARAQAEREQLEWLAKISTRHQHQLRQLQIAEARAAEPPNPWLRFRTDASLQEAGWDPAKHPRRGGAPNAGWFASTGGGGASGGAVRPSNYGTHGESGDEADQSKPPLRALALAGQWHAAKGKLEQYRRDIATLPARIANERAQLGGGGRYAYVHAQNLAKAERDLATAKSEAPKLEKDLKELERDYHESGYDDVEIATWTPGETIIAGKGIENVGRAVHQGGSPAGLRPTGDEVDVVLATSIGAKLLRAAQARVFRRASRPTVLDKPIERPDIGDHVGVKRGGKYGHLEDPPTANSGRDFTSSQKKRIFAENRRFNDGVLRDDQTGEILVPPSQRRMGVPAPPNEAQVDHVYPKSRGGPNTYSNAEVRSRLNNLRKGKKLD